MHANAWCMSWRGACPCLEQAREIWLQHGPWITEHRPVFGPGIKERFAMASGITDEVREVGAGEVWAGGAGWGNGEWAGSC